MRKLSYEEVKEYIELQGYKLISTKYVRSVDKMQMMCPLGHIFKMSFHSFKDGKHRCPHCYNKRRNESTRFTYEEVKEYVENFGYILLSKEYINALSKITLKCPNNHVFQMTFSDFKNQGSRCPTCANKIRANKQKTPYEDVKSFIESFGYKLISAEYENFMSKLEIECPLNHRFKANLNSFKQGHRCPICYSEHRGDERRFTYEYVKEYLEKFKYKLLSDKYENCKTKLSVECPIGHKWEVQFDSFKQGHRCPYCSGVAKLSYENVKEYIESFGYKLLSEEYNNNSTKLLLCCPNGHEFKMRYGSFQQGNRCTVCNISKGEQRIMDWLNKNNTTFIYDEKYFKDLLSPLGNPLRPDFILPDYKIWIEYDGEFHYENRIDEDGLKKMKIHDEIKNKYAQNNGWELIRIPYWDYDKIENILDEKIGGILNDIFK